MSKIKMLIVDDRDIIRDGLKLFFLNSNEIQITGEAEDGEKAISLIEENHYDIVLMDINMPNMNGIEATKKIAQLHPELKILANSFNNNPYYIIEVIDAGASGYITKGDSFEAYTSAIIRVYNGGIYISDEIIQLLFNRVKYRKEEDVLELL